MMQFFRMIFGTTNPGSHRASEFSRFFHEASSREKKRVYIDVARKASAEQKKVVESVRSMQPVN